MTEEAGKPQAGGEKPRKPKPSRAERSAANKAAHAAKLAAAEAAKAPPPLEAVLTPEHALPPPHSDAQHAQEAEQTPRAAPLDASPAQGAHTHARAPAHEGEIVPPESFAGLMDQPVPAETAATARYAGLDHKPSPAFEAAVTALRWAGQSDEEIALYLSCSIENLYRHYRVQLVEAHAKMTGKIAITLAQRALSQNVDFKTMRFVAEKRMRGFGRPDTAFVAVRPDAGIGPIDSSTNGRNGLGQSSAAMAQRKKAAPEIGEDGVIEIAMVLGVAERPLKQNADGTIAERTDGEIAADVAERGDA